MSMEELPNESVHLMVTSPPYFNAPFDYEGMYQSYNDYLRVIGTFAHETYRVLKPGRIAVLNIDDMFRNKITRHTLRVPVKRAFYQYRVILRGEP